MARPHTRTRKSYKDVATKERISPSSQLNSNPLRLLTFPIMPAQSRLAILPSPSSTEIMPYRPVATPGVLYGILESSFLTMTLKRHHIHAISEIHNCYVLDFYLASGMWRVLKDLSRSIHEAANPDVDPFESLPSYLNPSRLRELEMPSPRILQIENFSQNMLLSSTTIEEVRRLFNMAQAIGVETVEWIAEAKKRCGLLGRSHGWNWNGEERLDSDRFPLLEGQLLISEPALEPNDSNALILHPRYSNQARAQASAVFPSPTQFSQPPAYPSTNYDADIDLANAIRNMTVAE